MNRELNILKEFLLEKGIKEDELLPYLEIIDRNMKNKKYGLVWEEQEENILAELKGKFPVLNEVEDRQIITDITKPMNLLIEGDNLESLYVLNYTHKESVDIAYIDPPYNTGNKDFIYNDRMVDKEDTWRHSKWLSFMNKRLRLAKELLKKEGLIFISIDDNEDAQLKLLCDEIFSPENFINKFIWRRNSSGKTEKDKFTVNTEYVLLYSKSREFILNSTYKPLAESTRKLYVKNDGDGRGKYRLYPLQKPKSPGPETTYDYIDNNGKVWKCPPKGWRMKQSKLKALENDGRLYMNAKALSEKAYWNERENEGKRIDTLWDDISENTVGSKELEIAMGRRDTFDNPKPTALIKRCIDISNKEAVVLDFFAGSGTTGQAVMQLNNDDGGNRRYILCTNNQNNICEEVTYQRLKNIQEELPHNLKYFKTNMLEDKIDSHDNITNLIDKCTSIIQIKEECFNHIETTDIYDVIENNEKLIYIIKKPLIWDYEIDEILKGVKQLDKEMMIYTTKNDYHKDGITTKEFPQHIMELYNRLRKSM